MKDGVDLRSLIDAVELVAEIKAGGHLTLFRFSTGWKATLGTPDLDTGRGRDEVRKLKQEPCLSEALFGLIKENLEGADPAAGEVEPSLTD